ncbi:MAG: transcriptional repressor LexA [Rhodocyclaceae bacterium]|nr:transcriptional repressor LexA [Rhodocyclaceae bacterium]MCA4903025.1 transcriptional repressor LexA [Rhodocyclaceae bacterium]
MTGRRPPTPAACRRPGVQAARPRSPASLTRRQAEVLAWLRETLPTLDHPPTLDEVCAALGLSSRGSLHKHVQALVVAGLIEPMNGRQRGIVLCPEQPAPHQVVPILPVRTQGQTLPLLGRVAAGQPIDALEDDAVIEVGAGWTGRADHYALTVRGDSMIDEGIHDGDVVVIEHRTSARNGEIVVALIDGEAATLKRIEQRPGQVVLHPANPAFQPLVFAPARVTIRGVVKGLIRRYG